MSEALFIVGQRWISNGEADLGLGIVKHTSGRQLELFFPAVDESRFYAINNAPLSRVIYALGEQIKTQSEQTFTISAVQEFNGCYIYQGETTDGTPISIHEMDLHCQVHFTQAYDRLLTGQVDKNRHFELRARALVYQHQLYRSPTLGLLGARVQLLPHQLYIARQVADRFAPRVLLADEVGLGKTIEAGLILHQQLLSGRSQRALIIVPDSLLHQWLVEMLRRFNLSFSLMDKERFDAFSIEDGNPFDSSQLILCGLDELVRHPSMQTTLMASHWDLLIVDEAHHLAWSPTHSSDEYHLIEQLAAQIAGVILLTATPEQLGVESHFARLRLLDADKFYDLQAFRQLEADYQPINTLIEQLDLSSHWDEIPTEQQQQLSQYLPSTLLTLLQDTAGFAEIKPVAIRQLLECYGTGRVLFRNTREVVKGFPQRHLHAYPLSVTAELQTANEPVLYPESVFADNWLDQDERVNWLVGFLQQHRQDKVLLICAQATTAQQLEHALRVQYGLRTSVFHEGMTLIQRDRAAAFFADEDEGAQVLICSEIGSEGRNFQFCHHLVLFDLPLNPDLLEQRIGRLDRIGQQHDVHLHVPYYENTAQEVLLYWYRDGLNAFERSFPAGQRLYQQTADILHACLQQPNDIAQREQCIQRTQTLSDEALTQLQSGRHRLLERHSFDAAAAEQLVADLEEHSRALELADFMADVFASYGVEQQVHSNDSIIITPGTHMPFDFPALPEDGLTATYQRHRALTREDMAFLSWEHPMVLGALDLVTNNALGNSAFCTLDSALFPAGTLLLEVILVVNCIGRQHKQISRYLPQTHLRLLIDNKGRQYQQVLAAEQFNQQAGRIPKNTAQQLIRQAREQIVQLTEQAKTAALVPEAEIKQQAMSAMQADLATEKMRLQALAKVNPAIRQQELDQLDHYQQTLADTIQSAKLVMDAIRVAIVTD